MDRPEQKYSAGGIHVSVWKNTQTRDDKSYDTHNVTFEKRYKDKSGAWKSTTSLQPRDIPNAILVLSQAFEFVSLRGEKGGAA
ncbi:hypothetical protein HY641_02265 [Candidatus Woesearchaeota archaeon]|nr:hypothetical protein [Candidatus Woesearchaeota archaeon]